jgi:hypothetical protein
MIVFNAMEQIWLDNVYFPMRERLLPALCNELETNFNLSTLKSLRMKDYLLNKVQKLLRHLEKFQVEKPAIFLIEGMKKPSDTEVYF